VAALEGRLVMQLIMHSLWLLRFRTVYMLLCVTDTEIWGFCIAALLLLRETIQR
jgi:hypothetical protein